MGFNKDILKSKVFWLGVLGFVKVMANSVGIEFSDEVINNVADGLAGIVIMISMAFSVKSE